jgi:hypothetical protein
LQRCGKKVLTARQLMTRLRSKDSVGFHVGVLAATAIASLLSFGLFGLLVIPIAFVVAYPVALLTGAPVIWLLRRRGVTSVSAYCVAAGVIGFALPLVVIGGTLFTPRGETWVSPTVAFLGSAIPLSIAYCSAALVYWWWVFKRKPQSKGSGSI